MYVVYSDSHPLPYEWSPPCQPPLPPSCILLSLLPTVSSFTSLQTRSYEHVVQHSKILPLNHHHPPPRPCVTATLQKQKNKNCQLSNYKLQGESNDFCIIFIGDYTVNVEEFYSFSKFSQMGWNVYQTKEATATHSSDNRELICDICLISVLCPNIFVKL